MFFIKCVVLVVSLLPSQLFTAAHEDDFVSFHESFHEIAQALPHTSNSHERRQVLGAIKQRKEKVGISGLYAFNQEGAIPFEVAVDHIMPCIEGATRTESRFYKKVLRELTPPCTTDKEQAARRVARCIFRRKPEQLVNSIQTFLQAGPNAQHTIRKQFYFYSRGHYIEPYLDPSSSLIPLNRVLRKHIIEKMDAQGQEKVYLCTLLNYLSGPGYEQSNAFTPQIVDRLLLESIMKEVNKPSFVPSLLSLGADPHATIAIRDSQGNEKVASPIVLSLARLEARRNIELASAQLFNMLKYVFLDKEFIRDLRDLSENFTSLKELKIMSEVRKIAKQRLKKEPSDDDVQATITYFFDMHNKNERCKESLGTISKSFTAEEYKEHFSTWLSIAALLGADIKGLRTLVYPLVKSEITNQDEFDKVKQVRSKEFNKFQRFTMACLVNEFLDMIAVSLSGKIGYDLRAYCNNGEVIRLNPDDYKAYSIQAERYRNRLSPDAHALVESFYQEYCSEDY
jgi:hypothetical protein